MDKPWLWLGNVLALSLSWTTNGSVIWAIMHGVLGWIYVIYWALFKW